MDEKDKSILIFGSGFIGRAVANLASKQGHDTVLVDKVITMEDRKLLADKVNLQFHKIDLTSLDQLMSLDFQPDIIILTAAVVGVNNTLRAPAETLKINCSIVNNVAEWVKIKELKTKIVFTSTSEIYAGTVENFEGFMPSNEEIPVTLSDTRSPRFTYAISKIFGESLLYNSLNQDIQSLAIVRYHNVYGPAMGFKHVIPHLMERISNNENPMIVYGANQTRAFCYIDDAAKATYLVALSKHNFGEIFHVGNDEETSIQKLFETIIEIEKYSCEFKSGMTFEGSVKRRCPNISKLRSLGFEPNFDLKAGLLQTCEWYRNYFKNNNKPLADGFVEPEKLQ